jgi:AraC-like DNA-binding protein
MSDGVSHPLEGYVPRPPLSRYVELIWFVEAEHDPDQDKVLPNGVVELIVNLADPQLLVDPGRPECPTVFKETFVAGLQRSWLVNQAIGAIDLVGIRFKPGGFVPFFRLNLADLTDRVIDFDDVAHSFACELRERLREAPTRVARVHIVEEMLCRRLNANDARSGPIGYALATLLQRPEEAGVQGSISALADDMGMSHKHLLHLFHTQVGLGPRLLARILRFDGVIKDVAREPSVRWTDVAYRHGYYDQSHFIADFKVFAGVTPREYFRTRSADGMHITVRRSPSSKG